MRCVQCGRNVGADGFCSSCGFDNKHVAKACNTANYYYNIGLEKVEMRDLSGAVSQLKKALTAEQYALWKTMEEEQMKRLNPMPHLDGPKHGPKEVRFDLR